MSQTETANLELNRYQRPALIVGVVGAVLCIIGLFIAGSAQLLQSYLFAFIFWNGLALGCLAALMLQHLVGGRWGLAVRRLAEAGALTLPLMAVLFIPILLGVTVLYPWSHAEEVASSLILQHKAAYLNVPGFIIRAIIYFAVWITLAYLLNRWSALQDRTAVDPAGRWMRMLSGPGLVLYVLTLTFAATDWGMSLEPEWVSAIYGVIYLIGQGLTFLCAMIILLSFFGKLKPLSDIVWPDIFHDLGKLLFAFIVLWTYTSFAQFVIQWTGNLPEEIPWYIKRTSGGWQYLAYLLMTCQFFLPFLLLLSRRNKRRTGIIRAIAFGLLVMRLIDIFWIIKPAFNPEGFHIHWLDFVTLLTLGGFWVAAFLYLVQRKPLVPVNDPRLTIVKHQRVHHSEHEAGGHAVAH